MLPICHERLFREVKHLYVSEGFGLMQTAKNFNFSTDTGRLRFFGFAFDLLKLEMGNMLISGSELQAL